MQSRLVAPGDISKTRGHNNNTHTHTHTHAHTENVIEEGRRDRQKEKEDNEQIEERERARERMDLVPYRERSKRCAGGFGLLVKTANPKEKSRTNKKPHSGQREAAVFDENH